jgi:metallo-beta-lactamase family protein
MIYRRFVATLTFAGAARTVTGSKYILEHDGQQVLVDCGLFQGLKEHRLRNWDEFPVPPSGIRAVVLTHAHLDHVGYLPRLVSKGFHGPVFCTAGTAELSRLVLPDSARIQEEDARSANRHGYSKHTPALPLYTEADSQRALTMFKPVSYHRAIDVAPGVSVEFHQAGHLLGSAFVLVRLQGGPTVIFGGDLGRYGRPVLPDPENATAADVVLMESTYGDREHLDDDEGHELAEVIRDTAQRGGKLIIPSFAIGRVEELLYWVRRLEREERIPVLPVYVDSPMATEALRFYSARVSELDPDMRPAQREVKAFSTERFQTIASTQQSKELTANRKPSIVISASGMATGGRVLHHMAAALPEAKNTVLFVGYQAAGTRGRKLVDGATVVRIHGQDVIVRARIAKLDSMSAHADRSELLRWFGTIPSMPRQLVLVHGEPGPMDALRVAIEERFGVTPLTPHHLQTLTL